MPMELSLYLRFLHQENGLRCSELCKRYRSYQKSTIYHHTQLPIGEKAIGKRKFNRGRPEVLSNRDKRKIVNTIPKLRKEVGSFSARRLKLEAAIDDVSARTVRRCMNKAGYNYRQLRKKGLVSEADKKIRVKFSRKVKNRLPQDFWKNAISFYLDGVGFTHKYNPRPGTCCSINGMEKAYGRSGTLNKG